MRGKGIEAASFAAMVRYTLRAFAGGASSPSALLAQLHEALSRQRPPDRFCTIACAIIDDEEGSIAFALAGHPQPLVVTPGGAVRPSASPAAYWARSTSPT